MSSVSGKAYPDVQGLVIGVVNRILKHGVYIVLREYDGLEGYCHISEVAGAWIRNIRNFVRIDQNVVAKVLRVNRKTGQVDLSLKRVSDQLKKGKIQEYKRQNTAIAMVKLIAEKMNTTPQVIRNQIEAELTDYFGSMYNAFEEMAAIGPEVLDEFDFPKKLVTMIYEIAETSIQVNKVVISSTLGIRSFASDGVDQIRLLLQTAESEIDKFPEIDSEITSVGAPSYRVHLEGFSYDEVDAAYVSIEKALAKASKTLNLEYKIERDASK